MPLGSLTFDSNGNIDLGGGITLGGDGSVGGGTFTGSGNSFIDKNGNLLDSAGNVIKTIAGGGGTGGLNINQGLTLSTLGNLLGTYANQQGVKDASNLIGTYGTNATNALKDAIANQRTGAANARGDLYNLASYAQGKVNDVYKNQVNQAANTRADLFNSAKYAQDALGNVYNQQVGFQQPYQKVGQAGAQGLIDNQDYFTHQFDKNDLARGLAPNYDFMLQQGQMVNQRAANAAGGGIGGNALTGLNKFTQDYAGNAYQDAFKNYQTQRDNIYKNLSGMAGIGQKATEQLTSLGNTYGSNLASLSNNLTNNLTANSGQLLGAGNQLGGNLTSLGNNLNTNQANLANSLIGAEGTYGTNIANLNSALGQAQAQNSAASANLNAGALNALGNTALLSSLLGQKGNVTSGGGGGGGGGNILSDITNLAKSVPLASEALDLFSFSDERMKENIEFVEQTPNGINIYDYEYKPEFKDLAGHGRFRGVMAQEIEKLIPSAVKTMFNGYKAVNYSIVFPEVNHA